MADNDEIREKQQRLEETLRKIHDNEKEIKDINYDLSEVDKASNKNAEQRTEEREELEKKERIEIKKLKQNRNDAKKYEREIEEQARTTQYDYMNTGGVSEETKRAMLYYDEEEEEREEKAKKRSSKSKHSEVPNQERYTEKGRKENSKEEKRKKKKSANGENSQEDYSDGKKKGKRKKKSERTETQSEYSSTDGKKTKTQNIESSSVIGGTHPNSGVNMGGKNINIYNETPVINIEDDEENNSNRNKAKKTINTGNNNEEDTDTLENEENNIKTVDTLPNNTSQPRRGRRKKTENNEQNVDENELEETAPEEQPEEPNIEEEPEQEQPNLNDDEEKEDSSDKKTGKKEDGSTVFGRSINVEEETPKKPEEPGPKPIDQERALDEGRKKSKAAQAEKLAQAEKAKQATTTVQTTAKAGKTAQTTVKAATTAAKASKVAAVGSTPVGWIIFGIIAALLILLLLVGVIMFVINMPNTVIDHVTNWANSVWRDFTGVFLGNQDQPTKEEVINLANYLEDMGYDLEQYGFASNIERYTQNSPEVQDPESNVQAGDIKEFDSIYLTAYLAAEQRNYMIANQNWNLKGLFKGTFMSDETTERISSWGTGSIVLEQGIVDNILQVALTPINATLYGTHKALRLFGLADGDDYTRASEWLRRVRIDREHNNMIISRMNLDLDFWNSGYDVYRYSLEHWTQKYGTPVEFFLSLHLATLAPDFAYEIATQYDTKICIDLYEINDAEIKVVYVNRDKDGTIHLNPDGTPEMRPIEELPYSMRAFMGISEDVFEEMKAFGKDDMKTYTPYITQVLNHWYYKEIIYKGTPTEGKYADKEICVYEERDLKQGDPGYERYYAYTTLGDEAQENLTGVYVREIRHKDYFQRAEPILVPYNSEHWIELFKERKFLIYNQSKEIIDEYNQITDEKERAEYAKEHGQTIWEATNGQIDLALFAMLESVESVDAEYILRFLKELFTEYDFVFQQDSSEQDSSEDLNIKEGTLGWLFDTHQVTEQITDSGETITREEAIYEPYYWNADNIGMIYSKESDPVAGFEENLEVIAPGSGRIIEITPENNELGQLIPETMILELDNTGDENADGIRILISGVKFTVGEGATIQKGATIGLTTTENIKIIMLNKNDRTQINNISQYIYPPLKQEVTN